MNRSGRRRNELEALASSIGHSPSENKAWFEKQATYTLHRPIRKTFPSNTYSVNNVKDVWEFDLLDVQVHTKYKAKFMFLLSVINFFSKYLHVVPLHSKTGPDVTSAFESTVKDPKYSKPIIRRQVWVQTDRRNNF
jgi:hypothetical protein